MAYYQRQLGHGIPSVFRGSAYQKGHGVGTLLGGLFRTVAPLIKSGAATMGKELLRSGVGFLGDIAGGTVSPAYAAHKRFQEYTDTLKRKADNKIERVLSGKGYKKRRVARVTPQSLAKLLRGRTVRRKVAKKRAPAKKRTTKKRRRRVANKRRSTKTSDIFA